MIDKKDFELYFEKYKSISESLRNENISLEEAMTLYRQSKEIYAKLKMVLEESKLEIESFKE
ncbi:MAG: hypothetical protein GXY87_00240 [Tissierellia bacterium]|nr:hypothetical protein [Tissierellia bacterium]